jgi:Na+-transporting methylmalonyl-CoA/oxaloacetate decarboxylase gamma subunit
MDWVNNWLKDVVYMITGVAFVFIIGVVYAMFQIVNDFLQRRYVQQAKQPQKVSGEVKQPMGFL